MIDYFKIYNSRIGVIQVTPSSNGSVNIEAAKSMGTAENPNYDFENKIVTSLSAKERSKIIKMISDFDADVSKIPESRMADTSIYIDIKPVVFNHHKSTKPKNVSFQRQLYNGNSKLKKKQLTITLELLDKTSKYFKHIQSIDEDDYLILKIILEESIKREAFYNVDIDKNNTVFDIVAKGSKNGFKMKLPKSVAAGDLVKHNERTFKILGREFSKTSNTWKLYVESK